MCYTNLKALADRKPQSMGIEHPLPLAFMALCAPSSSCLAPLHPTLADLYICSFNWIPHGFILLTLPFTRFSRSSTDNRWPTSNISVSFGSHQCFKIEPIFKANPFHGKIQTPRFIWKPMQLPHGNTQLKQTVPTRDLKYTSVPRAHTG